MGREDGSCGEEFVRVAERTIVGIVGQSAQPCLVLKHVSIPRNVTHDKCAKCLITKSDRHKGYSTGWQRQ